MIRRCYNCGLSLYDQPALLGLKGTLCFPCLYSFDTQGGEKYLEDIKAHKCALEEWKNKYGDVWPKCEYLNNISNKISILCGVIGFISLGLINKYYKISLLIWIIIGICIMANRLLKRKIDSYGCPPRPSVKEHKRLMNSYEPEIQYDDSCPDPNPKWVKIENGYPPDWEERKSRCLLRDGSRCRLCGVADRLHVHHVKPISYGGNHSLQNLIVLCRSCHMKQKYFLHSLLVHHNIKANKKYTVQSYERSDGVTVSAHTRKVGRRGRFWRQINYRKNK